MGHQPGHDGEKPEFREKRDFVYVDGRREATLSPENVNSSRIKWLLTHNKIEQRQYDAGLRLQKDWEKAQTSGMRSSLNVSGGGGSRVDFHPTQAKLMAMDRHRDAIQALGPAAKIVELVVLEDQSLVKAGAALRMDHRFAAGALHIALHFLADHYRMG